MKQKTSLTLGIGARIVQHLGGVDVVMKILDSFPEELQQRIKYAGLTYGQVEALINRIGGLEVLVAILEGRKKIVIENVELPLVDQYGRFIPPHGFKSQHVDADREYKMTSRIIDSYSIVTTCQRFLPDLEFGTGGDLFKAYGFLRDQLIRASSQLPNLLRGPFLPLQLPKMVIDSYGKIFEEVFLAGVEKAYLEAFPNREFVNQLQGILTRSIGLSSVGRNSQLLKKLEIAPVNGLYFPAALQGFSTEGCREMVEYLPQGFVLSGGIETAVAAISYPKALFSNGYSVALDCAGTVNTSTGISFRFLPQKEKLSFGISSPRAHGQHSGGVFFLGFE